MSLSLVILISTLLKIGVDIVKEWIRLVLRRVGLLVGVTFKEIEAGLDMWVSNCPNKWKEALLFFPIDNWKASSKLGEAGRTGIGDINGDLSGEFSSDEESILKINDLRLDFSGSPVESKVFDWSIFVNFYIWQAVPWFDKLLVSNPRLPPKCYQTKVLRY